MWMNNWEIDEKANRYQNHPVLGPASKFLQDFKDVINANSDGWPYWKPASRAATKLMELVSTQDPSSVTEAQVKAAMTPIKAFCTKHAKDNITCPMLPGSEKTSTRYVLVKVTISHPESVDPNDIIDNCNYEFAASRTDQPCKVTKTELVEYYDQHPENV